MDSKQEIKNLLASYKDVSRRIVQLEAEIELTRISQMAPSAQTLSAMPKAHNATYDLSDYAARCDELLVELRKQYTAALKKKRLVIQLIDELDDETEKLVLWYRYIKLEQDGRLMRYEMIAVKTSYTYGGVRHIIERAYNSLVEKWPEISKKYLETLAES